MSDPEMDTAAGPVAVSEIIASGTARLAAAGVASPRTDAELLAAHLLGTARGRLFAAGPVDAGTAARFAELIEARARRVPLQHLTGLAPFRHLDLAVGPGVFVPRPETELLVDWALGFLPEAPAGATGGPTVVDLCSGSGAIALAVANERPGARVFAVERDTRALPWLRRNAGARRAAGDTPVGVVEGDVTDPDLARVLAGLVNASRAGASRADGSRVGGSGVDGVGPVDAVLCNPPYVPDGTEVAPEVAEHDPHAAVFGGPDGLAVIRSVVPLAAALLRPGGGLAVEHDETHQEAVRAVVAADGRFTAVTGHADLAGRPRFVTAVRAGCTGD